MFRGPLPASTEPGARPAGCHGTRRLREEATGKGLGAETHGEPSAAFKTSAALKVELDKDFTVAVSTVVGTDLATLKGSGLGAPRRLLLHLSREVAGVHCDLLRAAAAGREPRW